jgi:signal transduction histidine kinase
MKKCHAPRTGPRTGMRIAPRLSILIVFVLMTIFFVDFLSQRLTSMPNIYMFEQTWLTKSITETKAALADAPEDEWPDILEDQTEVRKWLDIAIIKQQDFTETQCKIAESLDLLKQDLQNATASRIIINGEPPAADIDRRVDDMTVIVRQLPLRMIDKLEDKGKGDVALISDLRINVSLENGDWLTFRTKARPISPLAYMRLFSAPIAGILMILIASALTAQSLLRPLHRLSAAAEKMGRERSITQMPDMHIPEYKTIADAFDTMQVQVKRFVDERTHMLAAISHDLRTLLTRMRLLVEDIDDDRKKRQILSNLSDMEAMTREYLIFARDDAQYEASVDVDISSLLVSICDTLHDSGIDVTYNGPDHAQLACQPIAMRRTFTNIIENGCKYGDSVVVTLEDAADAINITIQDRGPGIPDHLIEQAFKPFQRLETSRNRDTGGTGLGLSIARDIIHAHGGEIALENLPEGGLAVKVQLPKPLRT